MTTAGLVSAVVLGAVALAGFSAGVLSMRLKLLPVLFASFIGAGFVALMVVVAVWTASCPSCGGELIGEDTARSALFSIIFFEAGVLMAAILLCMWIGRFLSRHVFSRLIPVLRPSPGP